MTDYVVGCVLIFLKEFLSSRKSDLVDVFVHIILVHTDTSVGHSKGPFFFVNAHTHIKSAKLTFVFAKRRERTEFLGSVDSVAHKFTKENLMITVKEFFDYGEYIFSCYPNFTGCHFYL